MALESKVQPWMGVVAAVVLTFLALFPYRHFAGDDAYISFRFARNFAEGAGFAFNPGEPTYGSTSPLWIFLMAGLHRLGLSIVDADDPSLGLTNYGDKGPDDWAADTEQAHNPPARLTTDHMTDRSSTLTPKK